MYKKIKDIHQCQCEVLRGIGCSERTADIEDGKSVFQFVSQSKVTNPDSDAERACDSVC